MVIRLILRYLANNEQLVKKLSESYPIQAAARAVANLFTKGKTIAEEHNLKNKLTAGNISESIKKFSEDVKREIKEAKDEINRKK